MTESIWRLTDCTGHTTPTPVGDMDTLSFAFQAEGKSFCVAVTGRAGIRASDAVNAMRAAAYYLARAGGADLGDLLGARAPNDGELTAEGKVN